MLSVVCLDSLLLMLLSELIFSKLVMLTIDCLVEVIEVDEYVVVVLSDIDLGSKLLTEVVFSGLVVLTVNCLLGTSLGGSFGTVGYFSSTDFLTGLTTVSVEFAPEKTRAVKLVDGVVGFFAGMGGFGAVAGGGGGGVGVD